MRALLVALALLAPLPAGAACKLALALALDISSSVDQREYRLQIEGLADAIESPEVVEAILMPEGAHIAAMAYEWSGYQQQETIIDWVRLDSAKAIHTFAQRLRAHQRPYWDFATAIGKGIEYGARQFAHAPDCARKVIDVSGDGVNNVGVDPRYFYARGVLEGITVNGLVIRGAEPDPLPYYLSDVRHGPESFIAQAENFDDYLEAMKAKLLREIAAEMVLGRR